MSLLLLLFWSLFSSSRSLSSSYSWKEPKRTAKGLKVALHELMETARCSKKQRDEITAFFSISYDESLMLSSPQSNNASSLAAALSSGPVLDRAILDDPPSRSSRLTLGMVNLKTSKISPAPSAPMLAIDEIGLDHPDNDLVQEVERNAEDPVKAKKLTAILRGMVGSPSARHRSRPGAVSPADAETLQEAEALFQAEASRRQQKEEEEVTTVEFMKIERSWN